MVFKNKHKKEEAKDLVFALRHSSVYYYGDVAENIFSQIRSEIEDCEWRRSHFLDKIPHIPYETPFQQGDSVAEGLPDIIYETNDFVLGIEHFEFDAAGKTRKGSKMKLAEILANRELEKKRKGIRKYPIFTEAAVGVEFSYEGYLQSLLYAFQTHAEKIENYKAEIKKHYPNKKVYFAFFIEDVTAIGNYIETSHGREPIYPMLVKEFLDVVIATGSVDFIISRIQDFYTYNLCVYELREDIIESLRENVYDMSRDKYIPYHYKKSSHVYSLGHDEE